MGGCVGGQRVSDKGFARPAPLNTKLPNKSGADLRLPGRHKSGSPSDILLNTHLLYFYFYIFYT